MKRKDILKVIAYFQVYGLQLYAVKHHGYDTGKDNLVSYFCNKLGWSESKLLKIVRFLTKEDILRREPADIGCKLYSLSLGYKTLLKLSELEEVC